MEKNVLVVSGHPRLDDDSVANKAIVEELDRMCAKFPDRT